MGFLAHTLRQIIEYGLGIFDFLSPFWALTIISCLTGAVMLWFVGLTTPQSLVEKARSRIAAAIYEMRLYLDSPRHILAAQGRLMGWLAVYLASLMLAFTLLSVPLGLLYLHLDVRYGLDPLPVNEPLVVRVDLERGVDGYAVGADSMPDVDVTAPPVYIEDQARVYMRVVIKSPGSYSLPIRVGEGNVVHKRMVADPGAASVSPERQSGMAMWWAMGDEPPLEHGVAGIYVSHPDKAQRWLGTGMPWWAYWLIVATVVALLLRRPMGVVL